MYGYKEEEKEGYEETHKLKRSVRRRSCEEGDEGVFSERDGWKVQLYGAVT